MPCHQHQSFASIIFKSFFDVRIRSVELLFSSIYDASCGETLYSAVFILKPALAPISGLRQCRHTCNLFF